MIIKFGYYNDEDFGLTEYPEILFLEDGKNLDKLEEETVKKQGYTKYLITGIMEDFQYYELIEDFLENLKELKAGKRKKLEWDGQAFQYEITLSRVEMMHTIFGECEEYPKWSCRFKEFEKVLKGWKKFLEMDRSEESFVKVEI